MNTKNLLNELKNCRNELCVKCGAYRNSHNGTCDGCRYNFENMKKWDVIEERPVGQWLSPYSVDVANECSICHIQLPIVKEIFHYCPNCGAYMGGNNNG